MRCVREGDAEAYYLLGTWYWAGVGGLQQDYGAAASWFRRAADQGVVGAQVLLGELFQLGLGVPEDEILAHMWFNLAVAQGDETAREKKDMIEQRMTREQIAEAQRLTREWIVTHP